MSKALVVAGATMDKVICLEKLPEPKAGTIFSKNSYDAIGSTGCGKSISLRKLGFDTTFHAMIGADRSGDMIRSTMKELDIRFIYDIDPRGTEEHVNLMDDEGGRLSIFTKYATFDPELELNRFNGIVAENDYIILNIINYARKLIPIIQKQKKEIWCDIHDYDGKNEYHQEFIDAADYLFMSSDLMPDYQDFMRKQIERKKKLVVCTHGKHGVTALAQGESFIHVPIIDDYQRVDTNGAGDNFFAGFLYAHSKGFPLEKCLRYGSIAAGLCISSVEIVNPKLSKELINQDYVKHFPG